MKEVKAGKLEDRDSESAWKWQKCTIISPVRLRRSRGEKFNYLEKVNKVPGLKYEGAACSSGSDVREADRLKFFF